MKLNKMIRSEIHSRIMVKFDKKKGAPGKAHAQRGISDAEYLRLWREDNKEHEAFFKHRSEYSKNLTFALLVFGSTEDLQKHWPEISQYIPEAITDPVGTVELP